MVVKQSDIFKYDLSQISLKQNQKPFKLFQSCKTKKYMAYWFWCMPPVCHPTAALNETSLGDLWAETECGLPGPLADSAPLNTPCHEPCLLPLPHAVPVDSQALTDRPGHVQTLPEHGGRRNLTLWSRWNTTHLLEAYGWSKGAVSKCHYCTSHEGAILRRQVEWRYGV